MPSGNKLIKIFIGADCTAPEDTGDRFSDNIKHQRGRYLALKQETIIDCFFPNLVCNMSLSLTNVQFAKFSEKHDIQRKCDQKNNSHH